MPTVREILRRKGGTVVAVTPGTSVLDAAHLMNERGTGSVLVLEGDLLIGIFTERDMLRRIVAARRDPATTEVREVMTANLVTCHPAASLDDVAAIMDARNIRHLPVVDGARAIGVISSRDLLSFQLEEHAFTLQQMSAYIHDNR